MVDIFKVIQGLARLVFIFVAFCFCITAIYEIGYFNQLDLVLNEIPITLGDFIRDSFVFLPATIVASVFAVFIYISVKMLLNFYNKNKYNSSINKDVLRVVAALNRANQRQLNLKAPLSKIMLASYALCLILCIVVFVIYIVYKRLDVLNLLFWLVVFTGLFISDKYTNIFGRLAGKLGSALSLIVIITFALSYAYVQGQGTAYSAINRPIKVATILIDTASTDVDVIGVYENGILYLDKDQLAFTRWEAVQSIRYKNRARY